LTRVFGPVPSRRLGRSLGVDVVPYKTCTFDCVYCECGKTTDKRCRREEFYPLTGIIDEVEGCLSESKEKPDVITLSGAGEPTLYSRMGQLLLELKKMTEIPLAVITNSSLFDQPQIREELMAADVILPSLDSALEETFQAINRPHPQCDLKGIMRGLELFTGGFRGRVFFEILFVPGMNDDDENLRALGSFLEKIKVESVQLNTAVRPGTEKDIRPLSLDDLKRIKDILGPPSEIIAAVESRAQKPETEVESKVLSMIRRRPCTAEDMSRSLGIPVPGIVKIVDSLLRRDEILKEHHGDDVFYTASSRADE